MAGMNELASFDRIPSTDVVQSGDKHRQNGVAHLVSKGVVKWRPLGSWDQLNAKPTAAADEPLMFTMTNDFKSLKTLRKGGV